MTPHDDTSWRDYNEQFRAHTFPKIVASAAFISISSDPARHDLSVQGCTELGASLLLDKPLLLIVPPGVTPPQSAAQGRGYRALRFRSERPCLPGGAGRGHHADHRARGG